LRDCAEFLKRKIPLSAFNAAHVAAVDVRAVREVLLRPVRRELLTNPGAFCAAQKLPTAIRILPGKLALAYA
jgi:hypothetical protein